jgi:hypothetical protein
LDRFNGVVRGAERREKELCEEVDRLRAGVSQVENRNRALEDSLAQNEQVYKEKMANFRDKWEYMKRELLATTD